MRFVGRAADLDRLAALWARGERLVTIWGPGGIGKTRLAQEGAGRWAGPRWFCDLSRVNDREGLWAAVAQALGASLARRGAGAQLGRALGHRGRGLLVLDNFEQLADEGAEQLAAWREAAPEMTLLLTSRQRLRMAGEVCHELMPLGLPGPDEDPLASEAAQLFVACASAVDRSFAVGPSERAALAEVVRRLEGIPLAIELAASRIDVLGLDGLQARLPRPLAVLGGVRRGVQERQASIRGAVAGSWASLSATERRALAQCSVFAGGFALTDAEAVLRVDGEVLGLIEALRDKSMLRRAEGARLGMFESLRSFAREQLEELGEEKEARRRHAEHYRRQAAGWAGRGAPSVERDNLLEALEVWLGEPGDGARAAALEVFLALSPLLATRGPFELHDRLLGRVLDACEASAPAASRARLRAARARARAARGDRAGAFEDLSEALRQASGDAALAASVWVDRGVLHQERRELAEARRCYEEALGALGPGPEGAAHARALANLGALLHDARQPEQARGFYQRALDLFRRLGDRPREAIQLANLALLEQEQGQLDAAQAHLERAAELLAEAGDAGFEGITLANLGALLHERGELDRARALFGRALERLRQVGDLRSEALGLARLGALLASAGELDAAGEHVAQAEGLLLRIDDRLALASLDAYRALVDLGHASAALARGRPAAALAQARRRLDAVAAPGPDGAFSPAEVLDDVRTALRVAAPWIARLDAQQRAACWPDQALLLGPEASWFRAPAGAFQDLRQRRPLRALVALLARRRLDAPGQGVAVDELREAAWPGERIRHEAALNRLRVALAELRKRGLGSCLLRRDETYLLDPSVDVVDTEAAWEEVQGG